MSEIIPFYGNWKSVNECKPYTTSTNTTNKFNENDYPLIRVGQDFISIKALVRQVLREEGLIK